MAERDSELQAMATVIDALTPLDDAARARVVDYVFRRLGLPRAPIRPELGRSTSGVSEPPQPPLAPGTLADIRSLTAQKQPKTALEMAAIVAYYLGELAPATERKAEILVEDIKKYFKQANFPLPGAASQTLIHAKNAGYLDVGSQRGRYKLNPVGYNLVAHHLPHRDEVQARRGTGPKKKGAKKKGNK